VTNPLAEPPAGTAGRDAQHLPLPARLSLRSVPDGRRLVPLVWWIPLIGLLMVGTTAFAVLSGGGGVTLAVTVVVINLVGYSAVWLAVRPGPLRLNPRFSTPTGTESTDFLAPVTRPIPTVPAGREPWLRSGSLLLRSAAVALGASAVWSFLLFLAIRPRLPRVKVTVSGSDAVIGSVLTSLVTSILEECGMAVLILAVAGLAGRFLPARWDSRSAGYLAIIVATAARTLLHIPLWGAGAVGRIGLSFVLAWLFWRTRRVWPLIVAHLLWDTLLLQTLVSPSGTIREVAALTVLGWTIAGFVIAWVAISHSRRNLQHSGQPQLAMRR
jgi:membrane protease YdiL (CAAX protease family)